MVCGKDKLHWSEVGGVGHLLGTDPGLSCILSVTETW